MLVRFNKRTIVGGTTYEKDSEHDLANDLSDQVVRQGNGEVVGLGSLSQEAQFNQTRTGLVGFAVKRLTVEIANINNVGAQPSGSEWLFSAAQDLDTFTGHLQFEPTIFFDPDDTTSLNYGTREEPYNTVADFNRWAQGNRAGAVVGFKRGSELNSVGNITSEALKIQCYGTAANPVLFVPYGDPSLPMPIISGASIPAVGGTYEWALSTGSIWRVAVAADTDVFESDVRCLKKTWNTNAATTLTAAGMATYNGGYLYYWPRSTSNPNDGTTKLNITQWPIHVVHPDVATPGYLRFIGLDVRHGRGSCAFTEPGVSVASINDGIGYIDYLFCRMGRSGYDCTDADRSALDGSTTIISTYGVDATHRIGTNDTISSRIIGCELYEGTHHAAECGAQNNALVEFNYIHDMFGGAYELWHDASGCTFRNNRVDTMTSVGRLDSGQGSFWFMYNNTRSTYNGALAYDTTHALNVNNVCYNNWFKDCSQVMFICNGGSGQKIYNNTCHIDHDALYTSGGSSSLPSGLNTKGSLAPGVSYTSGTGANVGFLTWSNNLLYYAYSPILKASPGYANPPLLTMNGLGNGQNTPTGNYNCYFVQTGFGTANWPFTQVGGTAQAGAATSITLAAGASAVTDAYKDTVITITSGTGSGQSKTISAYNGTTKVATVSAWTTPPDATSVYSLGQSPVSNYTRYKAILAEASVALDKNSLCAYGATHPVAGGSYGSTGGTTTVEALKYTEATSKPATGSPLIQGGANVNANRLTDYIGQTVIAVATPAIGCYER